MSTRTERLPLHVGLVSPADPQDPAALSGAPHRMLRALQDRVERVSVFAPESHPPARRRAFPNLRRRLPTPIAAAVARAKGAAPILRWRAMPGRSLAGALHEARRASEALTEWTRRVRPDVLFGCYASRELYAAETHTPILYFSDFTARLLTTTYPEYSVFGPAFAAACDRMEGAALARADIAAFASDAARQSAIHDYGADPDRTFVVPLGANLLPRSADIVRPEPPTGREIALCIIGADPPRKRLDLAVRTTELLNAAGFDAVLNCIGASTRRGRRSRVVRNLGALRLGVPDERRRLEETIARSHLMMLPSIGEAFGLVTAEAAHFGRPSIVSDAGGLPTAVLHGLTGLVLPVSAGPADYARAIAGLAEDPDRYRAMSAASFQRAKTVLNWDAWGDRIAQLLVATWDPSAQAVSPPTQPAAEERHDKEGGPSRMDRKEPPLTLSGRILHPAPPLVEQPR